MISHNWQQWIPHQSYAVTRLRNYRQLKTAWTLENNLRWMWMTANTLNYSINQDRAFIHRLIKELKRWGLRLIRTE